jgi:hypothetical protein
MDLHGGGLTLGPQRLEIPHELGFISPLDKPGLGIASLGASIVDVITSEALETETNRGGPTKNR